MNVIKPFQYYQKAEIECQAEVLFQKVQASRRRSIKAEDLAAAVADFLDIGVVWTPIEPDAQGLIAAMIFPTKRTILINENISKSDPGFIQSTVAHEIGHWMLHIDQSSIGQFKDYVENGVEIKVQPFLCRSVSSQKGIEWQAQYFASCLLMPVSKLLKAQRGRNLTKWGHLYAMTDELCVTISNLRNRLIDLNWIVHSSNCKQIYLGKSAPN